MMRPVLLLHRWLGIIIGAVMTLWCLSGFVMLYVDYPRLTPAAQLGGLTPLKLSAGQAGMLPDAMMLSADRIEMMAGRPVLRVTPALDPTRTIPQMRVSAGTHDWASGKPVEQVDPQNIHRIAIEFGRNSAIAGPVGNIAQTEMDQWTVQTFRRNAPLYRVDYADAAGTQAYISGKSGEVVQLTTRFQRFWGWLGAVPHWLYPTILRQDGALWSQVVIWTSLIGCFLTITGLWVGIARLRRRRDGSIGSPYRGLWWWHHMAGLFFGILTLTWVASGLLSMNPWGLLDSEAMMTERQRLNGDFAWGDARRAIAALPAVPENTVRLEAVPVADAVHLVAIDRAGKAQRFDTNGRPDALSEAGLRAALHDGPPIASLDLLRQEDAYYYGHKASVALPVWRVILADDQATRLYVDPASGRLIRAFDRNGRAFRWLQDGLHRLDFPWLRTRPWWDLIVLPLLAMVTLVCGTGTWMGLSKLRRDLRRVRNRRRRARAVRPLIGETA
ncbi:PepSY domain-containing protein [Sphingobium yanoikuyae]|jgi:hypothetical protein|uniref:PepSY domain-containing protein n=1 Tax=Sphingobium yanoikuyae TaxID=13690 RepID=UPI00241CE99A|nr:PepSY domain-containing protein [Sphingobium yanoikuyae]